MPWSSHKRQKERENKREKKVKTIRIQEGRDMETPKSFRKQSYENMHADWLKIMFLELDGDAESAQAVDVMMAQAKRIYILVIKVNKLFSFVLSWCLLKEKENMFSVFLFNNYIMSSRFLSRDS